MSSYRQGKPEVKFWLAQHLSNGSEVLDVGACDGVWFNILSEWYTMDAVEVWKPNIEQYRLGEKYRSVFNVKIQDFTFDHYDLVLFGDVIEHMTVEDAQKVLAYAKEHSDMVIVAVPFLFKQDAIYGNPYERHIQDDLTHNIFMERYPDFHPIVLYPNYGYYVWQK